MQTFPKVISFHSEKISKMGVMLHLLNGVTKYQATINTELKMYFIVVRLFIYPLYVTWIICWLNMPGF